MLEIVDGLDKNGLLGEYSHVLSGYLKNVQNVQAIHSIIKRIKQINSNVVYGIASIKYHFDHLVFDPVIGDDGVYYIPKEIIPLYRELLCPISDFMYTQYVLFLLF